MFHRKLKINEIQQWLSNTARQNTLSYALKRNVMPTITSDSINSTINRIESDKNSLYSLILMEHELLKTSDFTPEENSEIDDHVSK